jgi:hypothetical protein
MMGRLAAVVVVLALLALGRLILRLLLCRRGM